MKPNKENFLAYFEGVLSDQDKAKFENKLSSSPSFKLEYLEFVKTYNSVIAMKEESRAPEGFDLEVMKAIGKISPVKKRSSIMKKLNKRFFLTAVPAFAMFLFVFLIGKQGVVIDAKLNSIETSVNDATTNKNIPAPMEQVGTEAHRESRSNELDNSNVMYSADASAVTKDYKLSKGKWSKKAETLAAGAPATGSYSETYYDSLEGSLKHQELVLDTESYNPISENTFLEAIKNPLSTFSIDVDTGSYANVRRFLNSSQLPPKDSVRIEEMLNYFKYDYKSPTSKEVPFSVETELANSPWNDKHKLLQIGLKGFDEDTKNLPASNLVFLVDVSGSMEDQNKLPLLKQGFKLLVDELRPQDRVAIVVYAGAAGVVLDSKDGNQKTEIVHALDNLQAGGSTAGGEGIELAYKIAKEHFIKDGNNRVILATDGDFNVGISNQEELVKMIEEKRKSGIFLSVLGFGTGNYQDGMMEQLANKGNGNYSYIDNIREAKKVLVSDFRGTIFTIAKDVKIQIEFNPAYVQAYRLIGYENRKLNKEDFNDDKKDAGELGAGHTVTALYEIVPVGVEFTETPNVDELKYKRVAPSSTPEKVKHQILNGELATVKLRYKLPNEDKSKLISQVVTEKVVTNDEISENLKFASSVVEFGMILRDSKHKGNSTFESAEKLAKNSLGKDELGYRAEFLKLIETAKLLKN
jgi:Ca-activated chloride channel family protein